MKDIVVKGNQRIHEYIVKYRDIAEFETKIVHTVCATFTLAREMEFSSRLFVLDMKEDDEEGIGTMLEINHISPALVDEELNITATVESMIKNELICTIVVKSKERMIATGRTGQKIIKKSKMEAILDALIKE